MLSSHWHDSNFVQGTFVHGHDPRKIWKPSGTGSLWVRAQPPLGLMLSLQRRPGYEKLLPISEFSLEVEKCFGRIVVSCRVCAQSNYTGRKHHLCGFLPLAESVLQNEIKRSHALKWQSINHSYLKKSPAIRGFCPDSLTAGSRNAENRPSGSRWK